jgi:hypothetical protein
LSFGFRKHHSVCRLCKCFQTHFCVYDLIAVIGRDLSELFLIILLVIGSKIAPIAAVFMAEPVEIIPVITVCTAKALTLRGCIIKDVK